MRIIYFGTPEFAVPSLRALVEAGEDVIAVVTQPDKVQGRGHRLASPPVKEFALSRGIRVFQPSGIRNPSFIEEMAKMVPECIVVVAYGKIIPPSLLSVPPLGCVNVHASLLPEYRGAAPIQWALINGEDKTGVTTMFMDAGMDTGDILLKEEVEIWPEDNASTLALRLSLTGASLLIMTLKGLKAGTIKPVPQVGKATYGPPLKKENGRIRWTLSARKILNLIRGTYPWPGAYCFLNGEKVHIIKAEVLHRELAGTEGCIVEISESGVLVSTGDGLLALTEVKPEGKKTMTAWAFANGRHLKAGMTFDLV